MKRTIYIIATSILFFSGMISCTKEDVATNTPEYGSMTDIQGNTYKTVKIGDQWWMAENLKVTVFNDNKTLINPIPENAADSIWENTTKAAYCIYDNTLGALYNWKVIDNQKDEETEHRLNTWCNVGIDKLHGLWAIKGAKAGKLFGKQYQGQPDKLLYINDMDWLKTKFNEARL